MSIRAVFRVRCDGPCHGWLTELGQMIRLESPGHDVVGLYPGERAARLSAQGAGWHVGRDGRVLCRMCHVNPLGIKLPSTLVRYIVTADAGKNSPYRSTDVPWDSFRDPDLREAVEKAVETAWNIFNLDVPISRRLWLSMPSQTIVWEGT